MCSIPFALFRPCCCELTQVICNKLFQLDFVVLEGHMQLKLFQLDFVVLEGHMQLKLFQLDFVVLEGQVQLKLFQLEYITAAM